MDKHRISSSTASFCRSKVAFGRVAGAAAVVMLAVTGCDWFGPQPPDIKFVPPAGQGYRAKVDFAQLEYKYPLTATDLNKITPENLATLDQEQIDQIYARLTAGPIPDGPFDGKVLFPRGSSGKFRVPRLPAASREWRCT